MNRGSIKQIYNSSLAHNIFYLFVTQGVNYLLPFLSLPFLFRVLGDDTYGIVATSYSYFIFLIIVIDFGFEYYSTKKVSQNSSNPEELNRIVSLTYFSKGIILLLCLFATIIIVKHVQNFRNYSSVFYYMMGIPIGTALFPMFFFQGMQKMKFVTIVTTITKCASFLPMFVLVRSSADVNIVSICYSCGYLLSAFISIFILKKTFHVHFVKVKLRDVLLTIKGSSLFFLSRVSASTYSVGTTILLNLCCGNVISGYYDVAVKLVNFATNLINPVTQALYPYMSSSNKVSVIKKFIMYGSIMGILLFGVFEIASYWIMSFVFGVSEAEAVNTFRILTIVLLFVFPSYLSGYPLLAARGYDYYVNITVVFASVLFAVVVLALYLFGFINIYSMSVAYILAEFFVFICRAIGVRKYKLLTEN